MCDILMFFDIFLIIYNTFSYMRQIFRYRYSVMENMFRHENFNLREKKRKQRRPVLLDFLLRWLNAMVTSYIFIFIIYFPPRAYSYFWESHQRNDEQRQKRDWRAEKRFFSISSFQFLRLLYFKKRTVMRANVDLYKKKIFK